MRVLLMGLSRGMRNARDFARRSARVLCVFGMFVATLAESAPSQSVGAAWLSFDCHPACIKDDAGDVYCQANSRSVLPAGSVTAEYMALAGAGSLHGDAAQASAACLANSQRPRNVQAEEVLIFDSFSGDPSYTTAASAPRSFIGMAFTPGDAAGSNPSVSRIGIFVAYTGLTTRTFSDLGAQIRLWDAWSGDNDPVFSSPLRQLPSYYWINVDHTFEPGAYVELNVRINPPIPLSAVSTHGIGVKFEGYDGAWVSEPFTALLRHGSAVPIAVGANALAGSYGYRANTRTDFNFSPSDSMVTGQENAAVAMRIYAVLPQDVIFVDGFDAAG